MGYGDINNYKSSLEEKGRNLQYADDYMLFETSCLNSGH